jgi:putative zinc- or iron-chelating protein
VSSIYFSFPDGVFDYVCAECNALCCRGSGFGGSVEREVGKLLPLYPGLESAATVRRGDLMFFTTMSMGCHFLDGDNLCRIEKDHGYETKPGVCRIFPFNSFSLIGKTLVVSPHFLCPLRIHVPAAPGKVEGTHERLEPVILDSGLVSDNAKKFNLQKERLHPSEGVRRVLAREIAFRDQCSSALGTGSFSQCVRAAVDDPTRFDVLVSRAAALLGLEARGLDLEPDRIDEVMIAIASTMRLKLLNLPAQGILLALAVAELVVRRVGSIAPVAPTPQKAYEIIDSVLPALHLLGCADAALTTGRKRPKSPAFGDPAMVFAGHIVLRRVASDHDILDALESGMGRIESVANRTAFLVEMGGLIGPSHRRGGRTAKKSP